MTRHARNNTAGAVYSYHERQRDTQTSGYGTQKARLGKESIKDFDACNLTLQPCRHPVITPDGFLYDKEAILEYIIHQKRQIARKLKEFEKQKKRDESDLVQIAKAEQRAKTESFLRMENSIVKTSKTTTPSTSSTSASVSASVSNDNSGVGVGVGVGSSISNMSGGRDKNLPSFWIPSMTPQSNKTKMKKPENTVYCPMSGKPLKASHFIDVHFTPVNDSSNSKTVSYMCAVTHDLLSNSIPCAVLKTSGCVVTMECVEKIIKKEMRDPINSKKLTEDDIIPLQRGGTGYSSTNNLEAAVKRPVMMA